MTEKENLESQEDNEVEIEVVEEPAAAEEETPKSKKVEKPVKKAAAPAKVPTIIPADTQVELSKFVFESFERNSRSVGLTQIRLIELGYMTAGGDKRGWLSTGTKEALESFSSDQGIMGDYNSEEVITAVFADTPAQIVP